MAHHNCRVRNIVRGIDYRALAQRADSLVADAAEYERLVGRCRKPVKNGWSGRTKERAVYLDGTHVRLTEMAQLCRKVMRHKAGLEPLIPLEFMRAKQEFNLSYGMFMKLVDVILHPQKIPYAAPEE